MFNTHVQRMLVASDTAAPFPAADPDLNTGFPAKLTAWLAAYVPRKKVRLTAAERAALLQSFNRQLSVRTIAVAKASARVKALALKLNQDPPNVRALRTQKRSAERVAARAKSQVAASQANIRGVAKRTKVVDDTASTARIGFASQAAPNNAGVTYTFARRDGQPILELDGLVSGVMEYLDELSRDSYYRFVGEGGAAYVGRYINAVTKQPATCPIFQQLLPLGLFDRAYLCRNERALARNLGLLVPQQAGQPDLRNYVDGDTTAGTVWVPRMQPLLFYDAGDIASAYDLVGNDFQRRPVVRGKICCYVVNLPAQAQAPCTVTLAAVPLSGNGRTSGDGAMRADQVREVDYRWQAPPVIAAYLGLAAARNVVPAGGYLESAPIDLPAGVKTGVVRPMASGIRYFRQFLDPVPGNEAKKNQPVRTLPLTEPPGGFSKRTTSPLYNLGGLTRKKKGDWQLFAFGYGRAGETLRNVNPNDRLNAASVMGAALLTTNLGCDGSASDFARRVLATTQAARDPWTLLSQPLQARKNAGPFDLKAEQAVIRTDQEWCHLYGHGDGGSETVENFVSGSKHCNTEQLAIELGQRTAAGFTLTAKITAYLFPGTAQKTGMGEADKAFLALLNPAVFDPAHQGEWLARAATILHTRPQPSVVTVLPTVQNFKVPTQAQFQALSPAGQAAVQKRIYSAMYDMLFIAWPLASVVRYKIYKDGGKIFDHYFWAQKESFDLNEFKILNFAVRRVVAEVMGTLPALEAEMRVKAALAQVGA